MPDYSKLTKEQLVKKLQEKDLQLQSAVLAKNSFLAGMSHDLRSPINGIMGMLQLLQLEELPVEQQEYIGMAVDSCLSMSQLLGDMLSIPDTDKTSDQITAREFPQQSEIKDKKSSSVPNPEMEQSVFHNLKVLVVEDDKMSSIFLTRFLTGLGSRVDIAESGSEALEALRSSDYELIFMDNHLPVMMGEDIMRLIRTSEEFRTKPTVPIISLTACTMAGDKEKMLEAGADGYLAKPVELPDLKQAVTQTLNNRSSVS